MPKKLGLALLVALIFGLIPLSPTDGGLEATTLPATAADLAVLGAFRACFYPQDDAARADLLREDPAAYGRMVNLQYERDEMAAGVQLEKDSPAFVRYEYRAIKAFEDCVASLP